MRAWYTLRLAHLRSAPHAREELRALGSKRSAERVAALEPKLRGGMGGEWPDCPAAREVIIQFKSFAKFGFPESHAVSFALIAYSTAYLKVPLSLCMNARF